MSQPAPPPGPFAGQWSAFDRYEVGRFDRRGRFRPWAAPGPGRTPRAARWYVRPVASEGGRWYEPWAAYAAPSHTRDPDADERSPHLALQRLLRAHLGAGCLPAEAAARPSAGLVEAVVGWHARFGPLGLLHHDLLWYRLPPAARPTGAGRPVTQVQWGWDGAWWREQSIVSPGGLERPAPPVAVVLDGAGRWLQVGLAEVAGDFFPGGGPALGPDEHLGRALDRGPMAALGTGAYAEPLDRFLAAAAHLAATMEVLGSQPRDPRRSSFPLYLPWTGSGIAYSPAPVREAGAAGGPAPPSDGPGLVARVDLDRMLSRTAPTLAHDGAAVLVRWQARSLLAALAHMAATDLAGRTLRRCASPTCALLFRSARRRRDAREARFCSYTCAHRENTRERRLAERLEAFLDARPAREPWARRLEAWNAANPSRPFATVDDLRAAARPGGRRKPPERTR